MQKDQILGCGNLFIVIFTDLDGTLLDHKSYDWDRAKPALDLCKRLHIPVIMVSSKTRSELDILRQKIGLAFPFISENGGGIFFPKELSGNAPPGTFFANNLLKWPVGIDYDLLVKSLREIRDSLGWHMRGFSEMSSEEISRLTGLDLESSRLAAMREFDEPFILLEQEDADMISLRTAAEKRGLKVTKGGRFYHLHGNSDKGEAVKKVISWYKESCPDLFTIALGDSSNDFPMFEQVDQPVLIRSQQDFPGIEDEIPGLMVTHKTGPEGWNDAILEIVGEKIEEGIS